jgi:DNA-binding IclR family transcriptional regulator
MPGPKTIRALERGLQVLDALRANPISPLQDLHRATRIPKSTLLRILHTLDRAGLVSRRLADGHYRLSASAGVVRKRDRHDRVAEAAAPVLFAKRSSGHPTCSWLPAIAWKSARRADPTVRSRFRQCPRKLVCESDG